MVFLLFLGSSRVIFFKIVSKLVKVHCQTPSSSQNKRILRINPLRLETSIAPYRQKACHNLFGKDTILCRIMCPIIKSLFHKSMWKLWKIVQSQDCTVTSRHYIIAKRNYAVVAISLRVSLCLGPDPLNRVKFAMILW